jgi:metal-responsive CopG/Arc/MetJ family transcriptional regulator
MARTTIKATYSLAPEVVDQLERLSKRWGLSRSKALTRAIRTAAEEEEAGGNPLAGLEALQTAVELNAEGARAWMGTARQERMPMGSGR